MSIYIIAGICLYIASYAFYVTFSHGLGHKAEYLQLRRFIPCAILAVLPMYLVNESLLSPQYLLSFLVGVSWITAYPLFYYLTKPYPLSRTFLREREKQQFLPEPLLLSFY